MRGVFAAGLPAALFLADPPYLPDAQAPTISQARAASRYAGACVADGDPECVQWPGGTGLALGHPAHLYLKRGVLGAVRHPGRVPRRPGGAW